MLLQYVQFPVKNYQTCKETGKYDPYTGQATETAREGKQMVEFSEKKDFQVAVINLFKERKETAIKAAMEGKRMMSHPLGNLNKETDLN